MAILLPEADEAALRESEEHYRHAVELSAQIPWTADPSGNLLEVGPRWLKLMGMTEEETLGEGWARALHPDDLGPTTAAWSRSLETGTPFDWEYRLLQKDSTYRWFRAYAAPRLAPEGGVLRWYGSAEEIHDRKVAEDRLRESEEFSRSILRSSSDSMKVLDLDGRVLFINDAGARELDIQDPADLEGLEWSTLWPSACRPDIDAAVREARVGRIGRFSRYSPARGCKAPAWADVLVSPILDADGKPARLLVMSRDVTEAKLARDKSDETQKRLAAVLESTTDNVIVLDRSWHVTYLNEHAAKLVGRGGRLRVGVNIWDIYPEQVGTEFDRHYLRALSSQMPVVFEGLLVEVGIWLEVHVYPTHNGLSLFFRDVTEAKRAREEMVHLAHHDALTGLANRAKFNEALAGAFARRDGTKVAVHVLDLDLFKEVNDAYGHPAGDALLQQVAARLRLEAGDAVLLARLGGDEFALIQSLQAGSIDPRELSTRLISTMEEPFQFEGSAVRVGVSAGFAVEPCQGQSSEEVFKKADIALYRAKADGGGVCYAYEDAMQQQLQSRQSMKHDLSAALGRNEFEVVYQPLVDLGTLRVFGFEALLRWHHAIRGTVSPAEFIPFAEQNRLIDPIGEWVLDQACRTATGWPSDISVAVNLSPVQFTSGTLPLKVASALAASGLAAERLELEITESVQLQDNKANLELLHALRTLGVRIALDDFGTGFSSLGYLRSFPFDKIKIDRSFVSDIGISEQSEAIIRAVIALGSSLRMTTTAEGVETVSQLEWLTTVGCKQAQGFLISKPISVDDIPSFLRAHGSAAA